MSSENSDEMTVIERKDEPCLNRSAGSFSFKQSKKSSVSP